MPCAVCKRPMDAACATIACGAPLGTEPATTNSTPECGIACAAFGSGQ